MPHASTVLILTGDDALNLEILGQVLDLRKHSGTELQVVVRLEDRKLARQLDREDEFVHPGDPSAQIEVEPFDEDRVAAQQLLRNYPLVDLADLRGQKRVHLVMIGWGGFPLELIEQLARLSPYKSFEVPRVDLFVRDPDRVRSELTVTQPALLGNPASSVTEQTDRYVEPVADVHFHRLAHDSGLPTTEQMQTIEPDGVPQITAVVIALEGDDVGAAAALSLRDRSNIEGRWQCPIFVRMRVASTLTELLDRRTSLLESADRVVPVGAITQTYRLETIFGDREQAARKLHEAYLESRNEAGATQTGDADVDWVSLPQTYRLANRRAMDHLPIKLLSAGYTIAGYPLSIASGNDIAADSQTVEALARLEHRSWEIDRKLAGWRGGAVRDNRRRINTTISIEYNKLDDGIREYDRAQIRVASRMLTTELAPTTVRHQFSVGVLGSGAMSDGAFASADRAFDQEIPPLIAAHREDAVSILTTLAAGASLVLTERLREVLAAAGVEHRIVVIRTLPQEILVTASVQEPAYGSRWALKPVGDGSAGAQGLKRDIENYVREFVRTCGEVTITNLLPVAARWRTGRIQGCGWTLSGVLMRT